MTIWNGTPALPSFVTGQILTAADLQKIINALHGVSDSWVDFSSGVAWSSSGTAPVIGNGSVAASYTQVNKLVIYKGKITMGSTTTFGTGSWAVAIPVAGNNNAGSGAAECYDTSNTPGKTPATLLIGSTLSFLTITGPAGATTPFTWAVGDHIAWTYIYEAA